jgi:hypothetical protein
MLTGGVNIAVFAAFHRCFAPLIRLERRIQAGLPGMTTRHVVLWAAKAARSRQRSGKKRQGGWQKRQRLVRMWGYTYRYARGCMWGSWA